MRNKMLKPFGITLDAPNMVAFYLMGDDIMVIENFNDDEVIVTLETKFQINADVKLVLPKGSKVGSEFTGNKIVFNTIPPRALVVIGNK